MPNGLEPRLRALLAQLPSATRAVEDHALAAALAALPPPGRRARPVRTALLVAAATVCLLGVSAGALGAAGALHVRLGADAATPPRVVATPRLTLPHSARGIAAVVDGRLWFTSRSGLRIEGLPVNSAALSPHALYVAAGVGDSLVVMAPGGTRAWSHAAGGRVVAIAWAPSGLRIAYVVRKANGGEQLRTIEGDGDHDRLLDAAVRSVAPSWRADALAVAYVGAGGRAVVYDFARHAHHVVGGARTADATRLAFAPNGRLLAVVARGQLWILGPQGVSAGKLGRASVAGMAWAGDRIAVALAPATTSGFALSVVQSFKAAANGALTRDKPVALRGRVTALGSLGSRFVLALRPAGTRTGLIASVGASGRVLFDAGPRSSVGELAVR